MVRFQLKNIKKKNRNKLLDNFENSKKRINLEKVHYVYITSTTNNTIFSITDTRGNVLAWRSCGYGDQWQGKEKSTEVAHMDTSLDFAELINLLGIQSICLLFKGYGRWIRKISRNFFRYTKITFLEKKLKKKQLKKDKKVFRKKMIFKFDIKGFRDITSIPFNGCRRWKFVLKNKKRKNRDKNK